MMRWPFPRCPVSPDAANWISHSLVWLRAQFGDAALRGEVVEPAGLFNRLRDLDDSARVDHLTTAVAARMGVDRAQLQIEVLDDGNLTNAEDLPGVHSYSGAAGTYERHDGSPVVTIGQSLLSRPMALVATIAHELAHVRLLGEGRLDIDRRDMEQMTDLAVVFFGLGVFAANASLDFTPRGYGWRKSELGYLGEAMFGFALAGFALMRDESDPGWSSTLDTNPRAYMRQSMRYLKSHGVLRSELLR